MEKNCKFCNIVRKWLWAVVSVPALFCLLLPSIIYGLLVGTIVLLIGKHLLKSPIMEAYGWNTLISLDQLANVMSGGDPDETISSRAGKRQSEQLWAKCLCWILNKLDIDHCKDAIEKDEGNDEVLK